MKLIQEHANQQLPLTIQDNETLSVKVTPEPGTDGKGRIGVQLGPYGRWSRRAANLVEFRMGAVDFQRIIIHGSGLRAANQQLQPNSRSISGSR